MKRLAPVLLLLLATACLSAPPDRSIPNLATYQLARDFDTYEIHRVGLMPFSGEDLDEQQSAALQMSFLAEFSRTTPFEVVLLDRIDLAEMKGSDPYRRGWYLPETIIQASRRYSLDAVLFGTVVQQQPFPPQMLSVQVDLVAAETGLVIWSSSVHLDASDERVQIGLRHFYQTEEDDPSSPEWQLSLLSPRRFARFAAYQVAKGL